MIGLRRPMEGGSCMAIRSNWGTRTRVCSCSMLRKLHKLTVSARKSSWFTSHHPNVSPSSSCKDSTTARKEMASYSTITLFCQTLSTIASCIYRSIKWWIRYRSRLHHQSTAHKVHKGESTPTTYTRGWKSTAQPPSWSGKWYATDNSPSRKGVTSSSLVISSDWSTPTPQATWPMMIRASK